ncbi:hypothetical protein PRNP1_008343 [Phytophthora ramorum]
MATEEVAPNPSAMAAHKAVDEAFPVCRVLGVLQRNGHLIEQSLPPKEPHEHQENRDFINQSTTQSEEIVSESPPSQVDEVSQETDLSKGELLGSLPCPKCGKTFPSGTSLRSHLADISLCESQPVVLRTEGGKMESKSCFKCGKTFASWQGLRGHLNRVKPCDQEKPAPPTTRRRPAASRTCAKCGKTFSSPQSLRIHMNRVKPCDQDKNSVSTPTTPPAATQPTPTLLMNAEDLKKEAERKAKARYQARKAYLKKRGRLGELGAPPSTLSGDGRNGPNETVSKPDLKRSATDEISQAGENVDSANVEAKRQCVQEEASSEELSIDSPSDVSGLTQPTAPSSIPPQKTLPMGGTLDFRKQIDELRVSIAAEKSKRETTVAALIAHEWNPRRDEFKALLESADAVNYPNEEQAHHAKWSEISNQLSLKDKVISALESQMDCLGESGGSSRSRYAEMGELSSKMAAEYSAKMALARDREGIYLDLVKSNTRIRSLVKSTLF